MSKIHNLSTLKRIPLREIWEREDKDFTPWLAKKDNLHLLLDEIGVFAENIETEANAGRYFVDITAEESDTGVKIIIENQLGKTDHSHLGQLLTYAANFDACIIVWVVRDATEEHQMAIEWFNDHIDDEISFFLVKTEVYQIEESPPAPKFTIIVQPNSWSKTIKRAGNTEKSITDTKLHYLRFWEGFKDYASGIDTPLSIGRTPRPQYWFDISIGSSDAHLTLRCSTVKKELTVAIYISEDKKLYKKLELKKELFHDQVGKEVRFLPLHNKKASMIQCTRSCDVTDEKQFPEMYSWLLEKASGFAKAFQEVIGTGE